MLNGNYVASDNKDVLIITTLWVPLIIHILIFSLMSDKISFSYFVIVIIQQKEKLGDT